MMCRPIPTFPHFTSVISEISTWQTFWHQMRTCLYPVQAAMAQNNLETVEVHLRWDSHGSEPDHMPEVPRTDV